MSVLAYAALAYLATAVISLAVVAIIVSIDRLFTSTKEDAAP